jgi:cysteine desulfuration protein SufE
MTDTLEAAVAELAEDFDTLGTGIDQIEYILDLGKALPDLPTSLMTDENSIRGCLSPSWLVAEKKQDGRIYYRGDAEAITPRGVIAVLIKIYSGRLPEEIVQSDRDKIMSRLGLSSMFTRLRSDGLRSMLNKIYSFASASI